MILTAVATIAAVAAPFAGGPSATFTADDYDLSVNNAKSGKRIVHHIVLGPERFLTNPTDTAVPDVVARDGQFLVGTTATTKGRKVINRYQAEPDGIIGPDDLGLKLARFAVTEARAGKLTLTPDVIGGRATLRVDIDLPANRCRKLPVGTATLWMTKTTLLPRRLEVERDGKTTTWNYRFNTFNQGFQVGLFFSAFALNLVFIAVGFAVFLYAFRRARERVEAYQRLVRETAPPQQPPQPPAPAPDQPAAPPPADHPGATS